MDNQLDALKKILPLLEEMIEHELSKHPALKDMEVHALSIRKKSGQKATDRKGLVGAEPFNLAAHCKLCTLPSGDTIVRCEPGPCPTF